MVENRDWLVWFYVWSDFSNVCCLCQRLFPKEVAGRVIGLLTLLYGIGAMAGPILGAV